MSNIIITGNVSIDKTKKEILTDRKLKNLLLKMISTLKHGENDLEFIKNINKPDWNNDENKLIYSRLVRTIFNENRSRFSSRYVKEGKNYEVYKFQFNKKIYYYTLQITYINEWTTNVEFINVYQWVNRTPLEMIESLEDTIHMHEKDIKKLYNNIDYLNNEIFKIKSSLNKSNE